MKNIGVLTTRGLTMTASAALLAAAALTAQPALAEEAFRELIEILPDDPLGHANLAIALMRQQKFEEAISTVDRALAKSPGNPEVQTIRGEILQWGGSPE